MKSSTFSQVCIGHAYSQEAVANGNPITGQHITLSLKDESEEGLYFLICQEIQSKTKAELTVLTVITCVT